MACTGTPCARCCSTQCLRGTGDRLLLEGPTLRQAQEEPYTGVIDRILEDDLARPRKQRHTAKRIFERLRDEYGFDGGYTTVKDYVRENRRQAREMFVPLSHPPGHAQCDFGEALVVIGGVEQKAHCADNGRDSVPPSLLATALLLQSHDKVSDAEAKARADFDIRWKVALGIEVEDRTFAKSTVEQL